MTIIERFTEALDSGYPVVMIGMNRAEIMKLLSILNEEEKPDKNRDYGKGYKEGYDDGYKTAVKDVMKKMKGMRTYGGDHTKERTAGVPEHHEE